MLGSVVLPLLIVSNQSNNLAYGDPVAQEAEVLIYYPA